jgi:acetone carboxylase gamma subunit
MLSSEVKEESRGLCDLKLDWKKLRRMMIAHPMHLRFFLRSQIQELILNVIKTRFMEDIRWLEILQRYSQF